MDPTVTSSAQAVPPRPADCAGPRRLEPDYANHPAYGKLFGKPKLSRRLAAFGRWSRGCAPLAYRTAVVMAKRWKPWRGKRATAGVAGAQPGGAGALLLADLSRCGAVAVRLDAGELAETVLASEPAALRLEEKRSRIPDGKRKHVDNTFEAPRVDFPPLYEILDAVLERHGILAAASSYLGFDVRYNCYLQINEPCDGTFWDAQFKDIGLPYPRTTYMHIDSTLWMLKCIVYLDIVTRTNGPFCFVLGSHERRGFIDRWVRKANDLSGLDSRGRAARELFWALPAPLRRKAAFGYDLIDSTPGSEALLEKEHEFTSDEGDLILFDNDRGVHRGAMVLEGKRRILQICLC